MTLDDPTGPLGYLITFRTYGTWLHGDARGSVDRHHNDYGVPRIPVDRQWSAYERRALVRSPVRLDIVRRRATGDAIRETCKIRGWHLYALNVRTNHVHVVVSASLVPERILGALKANATRTMRSVGCWTSSSSPWSDGGSTRYVWTQHGLECAIAYVRDGQGVDLD